MRLQGVSRGEVHTASGNTNPVKDHSRPELSYCPVAQVSSYLFRPHAYIHRATSFVKLRTVFPRERQCEQGRMCQRWRDTPLQSREVPSAESTDRRVPDLELRRLTQLRQSQHRS